MTEEPRIGVFVCHCGLNIAGVVDVEEVTKYARRLPNVVFAEHNRFMCSNLGQGLIKDSIKEHNLNRIVVASCSPRMHEPTFRICVAEAGLNPYLFEMANIREHCSWAHSDEPEKATQKAKELVRMAVARASLLEGLETIEVPVINKAMVLGGGIAGINAALDLAEMGFKVYLVEKKESIGGHMAQLDKTFPTLDCSICIEGPKMVDVSRNLNIEIISFADILSVEGHVGNFKVKVRKNPRYVIEENCTGCSECRDVCPIEYPNEWDEYIGLRKAISVPFDQAVPLVYTINMDHCIECYKCVEACGPRGAINLDQKPEVIELEVGAIIVATGFDIYRPYDYLLYGYGKFDNVITALELERLILAAGPTGGKVLRASDGKKPKTVAFIQCVGSRDINKYQYCSGFCCMYTLKQSIILKEKYKEDVQVHVLYAEMRTNFKGYEKFYRRAQELGVKFLRAKTSKIVEDPETKNLTIHVMKENGDPIEVKAELVVLSTAAIPSRGSDETARILGIPREADGFFMESHPKLKPIETAVDGVFLAGACQGLKDIPYSVAQGSGAAARAANILSKTRWEIEPILARIDEDYCSGCRICEIVCEYGAIEVREVGGKLRAHVLEALCKGCGVCSSSCPAGAVTMLHFTDEQIQAQVRAALREVT